MFIVKRSPSSQERQGCSFSPSCLALFDPLDSGSSVHGILQARILEGVAMPSSRVSSLPRDQTQVSCTAGRFYAWDTREAPFSWFLFPYLGTGLGWGHVILSICAAEASTGHDILIPHFWVGRTTCHPQGMGPLPLCLHHTVCWHDLLPLFFLSKCRWSERL